VSTKQNPQGQYPGGPQNDSDGTRVEASLPAGELLDTAIDRLYGLTDEQLHDLVAGLDAALKSTGNGPTDAQLEDAITIAAAGRILLRRRRAAAGRSRALSIVRDLTSATETQK
jgi:hypothetical protein